MKRTFFVAYFFFFFLARTKHARKKTTRDKQKELKITYTKKVCVRNLKKKKERERLNLKKLYWCWNINQLPVRARPLTVEILQAETCKTQQI
jgi:Tfp pilus assembly protein PilO